MREKYPSPLEKPVLRERLVGALDAAIYAVAPVYGARRMATREKWRLAQKWSGRRERQLATAMEDDDRIRGSKWISRRLSPDSLLEESLEKMRERSESLQKDPFAAGAVEGMKSNVIGTGIIPQARVKAAGLNAESAKELNTSLERLYAVWACRCDKTRQQSMVDQQKLALQMWLVQGECFLLLSDVKSPEPPDPREPLPLAIEIVDASRVATPPGEEGNPLIRLGVEKDESGRILAYHVRHGHPNDAWRMADIYERIPAWRMLHLFEQLWPGQSRGIPWFHAVMNRLKDLGDFAEAELIKQQTEQCFSAFVTNGAGDPTEIAAAGRSSDQDASGRIEEIEPGRIQYLSGDQQVTFGNPTRPGNTLAPYMQWQLRAVAAGLNYPYELLVKDYRELSYSGGRLALIDGRVMFRQRQASIVERLLEPLWAQFIREVAIYSDEINILDYEADPLAYESVNWQCPGWPWVDPLKEVQASSDALDADLTTLRSELAGRGMDLEDNDADREVEQRMKIVRFAKLKKEAISAGLTEEEAAAILLKDAPKPAPAPPTSAAPAASKKTKVAA